jgi:hypothetical protein
MLLTNSVNKSHYFQCENMIDFFKAKWTKWNYFTVFHILVKYFFCIGFSIEIVNSKYQLFYTILVFFVELIW